MRMPRLLFPCWFFIASFLCSSLAAGEKRITPEGFEWISKTSLNVMATYQRYDELIKRYDPKLLFNIDAVRGCEHDYITPTTIGDLTVVPVQLDFALYGNWRIKQTSLGFLAVANTVDLRIAKEAHPDLNSGDGPYGILYGWYKRYILAAFRGSFGENIKLAIGEVYAYSPYVVTALDGSKQFGLIEEQGYKEYKTTKGEKESFLYANFYGYEVGGIHDFKKVNPKLFQLRKFFNIGKDLGELIPGVNYYRLADTTQAGIEHKDFMLTPNVSLGGKFFLNIHERNRGAGLAYITGTMSAYFLKDKAAGEDDSKRDLYISLTPGLSYSRDIFDEDLWGYSLDIALENFPMAPGHEKNFGQGKFAIGVSRNYHGTLHRVPIKDEMLLSVAFQWMI